MNSPDMLGIGLGLFFALAVFALKTAVGAYYFLAVHTETRKRMTFFICSSFLYLLLFAGAFTLIRFFDLFQFAADSTLFLKSGVLLHMILCAGMLIWGLRLLGTPDNRHNDSINKAGWLMLSVPCPVCASAIFLICAFASILWPEYDAAVMLAVPAVFFFMNIIVLVSLALLSKYRNISPVSLTGKAMILIALYFILILLVAPQMNEAGKLYSIARSTSGSEINWMTVGGGIFVLACGFIFETLKRKGNS